jgi:hypothetical protein
LAIQTKVWVALFFLVKPFPEQAGSRKKRAQVFVEIYGFKKMYRK